jgi:hypothetical protein
MANTKRNNSQETKLATEKTTNTELIINTKQEEKIDETSNTKLQNDTKQETYDGKTIKTEEET